MQTIMSSNTNHILFGGSIAGIVRSFMGIISVTMFLAVSLISVKSIASGAEGLTQEIMRTAEPQTLTIEVGKSVVLRSPIPIKRASLGHPDIANTLVLSPTQLYLYGKVIGTTNLTFWGRDGHVFAIYNIVVQPDLTRLKAQLHELFPEENGIKVHSAHDHITLSGSVSGTDVVDQILEVANAYAPKKIMNLLQVGGVQQVMLEVRVAEMQRSLLKRLGINFGIVDNGGVGFGATTLNGLSEIVKTSAGTLASSVGVSPFGFNFTPNVLLRGVSGALTWTAFIDALKGNNLTKVLAEPTLVTSSGQEATFLAGGEFPIPVPQSFGVTTIKYKQFGIGLKFNPIVMSEGRISMKVSPEVSQLDAANGVSIVGGITIPALTTRRVDTVIELQDGQSFAMAGLIQENIREAISKYPVLGDIPVLGTLFRSTSFQKDETELVVIVTVHLVKPADMRNHALPTDAFLEPNDFEFLLMGYMEGVRESPNPQGKDSGMSQPSDFNQVEALPLASNGGLEGPFGHLAP